jgi:threonylcarbamoyladenosine tRNA methylthiotransferase MtaB
LRGKNISFPYRQILDEAQAAAAAGFGEIVLTGVDIAGYINPNRETITPLLGGVGNCKAVSGEGATSQSLFLSELCENLLRDVSKIRRLRLSSLDPASPEIPKLIALSAREPRVLPHFHLSMQSGSDAILAAMGRRHNAEMVRALNTPRVSFSWDLICGFPGETPEKFAETVALIRELKPIHIHAFPFSPRPGTPAAEFSGQIDRAESKRRVRIVQELARENKLEFMRSRVGKSVEVLVEADNLGRAADDIEVLIAGASIPTRTIATVQLQGLDEEKLRFLGEIKNA